MLVHEPTEVKFLTSEQKQLLQRGVDDVIANSNLALTDEERENVEKQIVAQAERGLSVLLTKKKY